MRKRWQSPAVFSYFFRKKESWGLYYGILSIFGSAENYLLFDTNEIIKFGKIEEEKQKTEEVNANQEGRNKDDLEWNRELHFSRYKKNRLLPEITHLFALIFIATSSGRDTKISKGNSQDHVYVSPNHNIHSE